MEEINRNFRVRGRWIRTATLEHEWYDELGGPEAAIREAKAHPGKPDIFTFIQRPPQTAAPLPFYHETDHVAAIPITTFDHWFEKQVIKKTRKNVRRSQKHGVTVRRTHLDDTLVNGIMRIHREVPMRSGRPFRHFDDDFETCKRKHATFPDRSIFIGAYHEERLIGFIKMVLAGSTARTMQFISMDEYRDYSPANALLCEAVKICAERGITHLVYGKLNYGKRGNAGLEEFKRANGFERLEFPRYFVPFTWKGRLAIRAGLHGDLLDKVPQPLLKLARDVRTRMYLKKYGEQMRTHEKKVRRAPVAQEKQCEPSGA